MSHVNRSFGRGVIVLLLALVLTFVLTGCQSQDGESSSEESSGSSEEVEKATSPEGYLPPEVVEDVCADCSEVVQEPLSLNDEAKYQFSYDGHGDTRYLIMTGVEAEKYTELLEASKASEATAGELKELDDVGGGAFVQGSQAIMVKGEDTVLLWSPILQDISGEEFQPVSTDELEQLLREIDARM